MKYQTAISTNIKNGHPTGEKLRQIRDAGFDGAMLDERDSGDLGDLKNFIAEAKRVGLEIPYVHLINGDLNSIWLPRDAKQDQFVQEKKRAVQICGDAGIKTVVMHSVRDSQDISKLTPNENALKPMEQILRTAEDAKVNFALENSSTDAYIDFLMKHFGQHPNLSFCYDSGHDKLFTRQRNLLGKYKDKVSAIHLNDTLDIPTGKAPDIDGDDVHMVPFDGTDNWQSIIRQLGHTSYNGAMTLEVYHHAFKDKSFYKDESPEQFLKRARKTSQTLGEMLERERN